MKENRYLSIVAQWNAGSLVPLRNQIDSIDNAGLTGILWTTRPIDIALLLKQGGRPKLVIMDNLNGSGKDVADEIRKVSPGTIIIFYSIDNSKGRDRPDGLISTDSMTNDGLVVRILTWPQLATAKLADLKAAFPEVEWLR